MVAATDLQEPQLRHLRGALAHSRNATTRLRGGTVVQGDLDRVDQAIAGRASNRHDAPDDELVADRIESDYALLKENAATGWRNLSTP